MVKFLDCALTAFYCSLPGFAVGYMLAVHHCMKALRRRRQVDLDQFNALLRRAY